MVRVAFLLVLLPLFTVLVITPSQLRASEAGKKGNIIIYSYGPARVQVTGPDGMRAGVDLVTGRELEEITSSDVSVERTGDTSDGRTITLKDAMRGIYHLEILGTGTGRVVVDLEARDASGKISRGHVLRKVKDGGILRYALDYNTVDGMGIKLEEISD